MEPTHQRLGELDLIDRLNGQVPPLLVQLCFATVCILTAIMARYLVDVFAPTAGPFSLIYPAIMIATLFGRWGCGMITLAGSFLYAWYFVLPEANSFAFANPQDGARTFVNGMAATVIMIFAEVFRRAVHRAAAERDRELENRVLLMRELEHRTKNNFAMVASLLDIQRRRHEDEQVREALQIASQRVKSFADIHQTIFDKDGISTDVSMHAYLSRLSQSLSETIPSSEGITLKLECSDKILPRGRAIAIGLVLNEVVTNAVKHAFTDGNPGEIVIRFDCKDGAPWHLSVTDDGRGMPQLRSDATAGPNGLGSRLIERFAQEAGAELRTESLARGTRVSLSEMQPRLA